MHEIVRMRPSCSLPSAPLTCVDACSLDLAWTCCSFSLRTVELHLLCRPFSPPDLVLLVLLVTLLELLCTASSPDTLQQVHELLQWSKE